MTAADPAGDASRAPRRPNILWISTHDINPHIGAYAGVWPGADAARTPHLDRLARGGARYDHAFASAPVCAPSRSAIMTGCFPTAIGTMHMRTKAVPPPEVTLFSEYFRAAGYYTTNNWFTDFQVQTPPTAFDDCGPTAHWRDRPDPETPFFAIFHGMATHESQIYLDDDAFAAATAHVSDEQRHDPEQVALPPYYPDTAVFRTAMARYLDLISEMDHWVGTLLAELEEDGLAGETIVVFWSDHGAGMPRAKRWAHEAGLREPLIVRWPGVIPGGTERTELVHLLDLGPTMLTACGLVVPEHMHGVSFLDSDGGFVEANEYAYGGRDRMDEQEDGARTVRDRRYRYIRNLHPDRSGMQHADYADHYPTWREFRRLRFEEAGEIGQGGRPTLLSPLQRSVIASTKPADELYDLVEDPHETRNLASDPRFEEVRDRLRAALDAWTERYGDLGLMPESELLERWRPGGLPQRTAPPSVQEGHGRLVARCETDGASIGWTTDPPRAPEELAPRTSMERVSGSPERDGRYWHLYSEPVPLGAATIWFRAWRLGFEPSAEVEQAPVREPGS